MIFRVKQKKNYTLNLLLRIFKCSRMFSINQERLNCSFKFTSYQTDNKNFLFIRQVFFCMFADLS